MLIATLLVMAAVAAPTTGPVTDVTNTSATLTGTVEARASVFFEYGRTTDYGLTTTPVRDVEAGDLAIPVSNLTADTTYHYRLVAEGEPPGEDMTFTTAANPLPPTISNQQARDVMPESATATASVNPNGSTATYFAEWGTTTRYGRRTASATAGSGKTNTTVTARLEDLRPFTRYHWRTVAANAAGITRGRDRTFRTRRDIVLRTETALDIKFTGLNDLLGLLHERG